MPHHSISATILLQDSISIERPLIPKWENNLQALSLASINNKAVILLPDGILASITSNDGQLKWRTAVGGKIVMPPIPDQTLFYVHTSSPNQQPDKMYQLLAVDINTGIIKWRITLPAPISKTYLKNPNPNIYVLLNNQTLLKLNKFSGETACIYDFPKTDSQVIYFDENMIAMTSKESIITKNIENNNILWQFNLANKPVSGIISTDALFIVATKDGYFHALNKTTGKLIWKKKITKNTVSLIPTENGLLITNTENNMYFCTLQGKIKWKKLLDGKFSDNLLIQHSSVLLFPVSSNSGIVLSLKNGKLLNRIRIEELNFVIAPPVVIDEVLLLQTQKGILAFSNN